VGDFKDQIYEKHKKKCYWYVLIYAGHVYEENQVRVDETYRFYYELPDEWSLDFIRFFEEITLIRVKYVYPWIFIQQGLVEVNFCPLEFLMIFHIFNCSPGLFYHVAYFLILAWTFSKIHAGRCFCVAILPLELSTHNRNYLKLYYNSTINSF